MYLIFNKQKYYVIYTYLLVKLGRMLSVYMFLLTFKYLRTAGPMT